MKTMRRWMGAFVATVVVVAGSAGTAGAARPTGPPEAPTQSEPVCQLSRFPQAQPLTIDGATESYSFGTIKYVTQRAAINLYTSRRAMPKLVRVASPTVAFVNDPARALTDPRLVNLDDDVWAAVQQQYPQVLAAGADCAFPPLWGSPYPRTDIVAPVLSLPSDMRVQATSAAGAVASFTATATDDVDGSVAVTCTPPSGSVFPIGVTTVDCSAIDSAGNPAVGSFDVTVGSVPFGWVSTFLGVAGQAGSDDGTGADARLNSPWAVTVDNAGRIIVADYLNCTIRVASPAGELTTLAGSPGVCASIDGVGPTAAFAYPNGVAVDSENNIYVSDSEGYSVRKVTPEGVVTTFAGSGASGSADGVGEAASFNRPYGIAVDDADHVYVADQYNCTIRRISPAAEVTTFAGSPGVCGATDGTGPDASFSGPIGLAFDTAGNLYVADQQNNAVRKVSPAAEVTTFVGSEFGLELPVGVTVDNFDNVYVSDAANQVIRRFTQDGAATILAGAFDVVGSSDGFGADASFDFPYGLGVDADNNLYVADTNNHTVRRIT